MVVDNKVRMKGSQTEKRAHRQKTTSKVKKGGQKGGKDSDEGKAEGERKTNRVTKGK
jgi:hypothetical protein